MLQTNLNSFGMQNTRESTSRTLTLAKGIHQDAFTSLKTSCFSSAKHDEWKLLLGWTNCSEQVKTEKRYLSLRVLLPSAIAEDRTEVAPDINYYALDSQWKL